MAAARPGNGLPSPRSDPYDDEQAAKRARAESYRSSLAAANDYVKRAEADLKWAEEHWRFVNSHTNQTFPLDEARGTLAKAKKELERVRKQREDIEDAARRESIPPGWLR